MFLRYNIIRSSAADRYERERAMGTVIENTSLRDSIYVFKDRYDAGRMLADTLRAYKDTDALLLAIPSGGVPVASAIASVLNLPMELIITRKLQIPYNPEAGFGAVSPDGEVVLNERLLAQLRLTEEEINAEISKTLEVLKKRSQAFRKGRPLPEIENKVVIVVDDGLASGYTMLAAIRYLKKTKPRKIVVAVPTGLQRTIDFISREVDELVCLNVRTGYSFAVAEAYRTWYDLTDEDVLLLVRKLDAET